MTNVMTRAPRGGQKQAVPSRKRQWWRWAAGGAGALVVVVVAGLFVYVHYLGGPVPAPLTLPKSHSRAAGVGGASIDGTWTVGTGSLAGYRVREDFLGPGDSLVGRTSAVVGKVVVAHGEVTSGSFSVELGTVKANGKLQPQFAAALGTAKFPDATFTLSEPVVTSPGPVINKAFKVNATGLLAMHGTTQRVSFEVTARYNGAVLEEAGSVPVVLSKWGINAPALIEDNGAVEFFLVMHR
ncbi:MAG: YceI family protein [Acidimicrobiales bacterium]|jgi:polyisoprenoid-binding protein YceI